MLQINNSSFEATLLASSSSELVAIMFVGVLITVVCVGARLTVVCVGASAGRTGAVPYLINPTSTIIPMYVQ